MNKIMEYMYFGLPIVAYDLTENRLSADAAAVYAEANREHELARSIAELLDDPTRGAQMGAIGRRRLSDHLAWEHSAPILLAAYQRLLATAGQRPQAIVTTVRDSEALALERGDIT
jgi:glycosyltransferase involved in cell wall biosynthesis